MIFSGEARLMRIASKSLVSAPLSWKLGLMLVPCQWLMADG
jgi:hypothetical protein